ncbi:hypothetical protein ILUMI_19700 [Ignelater luminosus]|uniref:PiggyBac transposable element-derived protein domain-containing protein n=1 Tax=Ignelater luminosus TaxID=2038154 RepID=A0A8K0CL71_IGNLU|nr:hypothetical protein ILUMI_19700 [Ignelater luminosus]
MNQRLRVNEQMCSSEVVLHLRQCMPTKLHEWCMKLFMLCDSNGLSYGFGLYAGTCDNVVPNRAPDLGAAANVVSRLSHIIQNHENRILRGIYSLRTIPANRISNCKPTDNEVANQPRGYATEYVGSCYCVDISKMRSASINLCWSFDIQKRKRLHPKECIST